MLSVDVTQESSLFGKTEMILVISQERKSKGPSLFQRPDAFEIQLTVHLSGSANVDIKQKG